MRFSELKTGEKFILKSQESEVAALLMKTERVTPADRPGVRTDNCISLINGRGDMIEEDREVIEVGS